MAAGGGQQQVRITTDAGVRRQHACVTVLLHRQAEPPDHPPDDRVPRHQCRRDGPGEQQHGVAPSHVLHLVRQEQSLRWFIERHHPPRYENNRVPQPRHGRTRLLSEQYPLSRNRRGTGMLPLTPEPMLSESDGDQQGDGGHEPGRRQHGVGHPQHRLARDERYRRRHCRGLAAALQCCKLDRRRADDWRLRARNCHRRHCGDGDHQKCGSPDPPRTGSAGARYSFSNDGAGPHTGGNEDDIRHDQRHLSSLPSRASRIFRRRRNSAASTPRSLTRFASSISREPPKILSSTCPSAVLPARSRATRGA